MASALRSTIAPVARALSSAAQSTPVRRQILFLGAPGVGKGTYASRIAPLLNAVTIATGDLVRDEIKAETRLGNKIKARAPLLRSRCRTQIGALLFTTVRCCAGVQRQGAARPR